MISICYKFISQNFIIKKIMEIKNRIILEKFDYRHLIFTKIMKSNNIENFLYKGNQNTIDQELLNRHIITKVRGELEDLGLIRSGASQFNDSLEWSQISSAFKSIPAKS